MPFPNEKLRFKREGLGLSRDQLAKLSGLTPRYVEALEQGRKQNPTMDTISGLCTALGVDALFFFGENHVTESPPAPVEKAKRGRPKKIK